MSDVLLHASFPADEFEKWKTRQRSQLEQARTQPNTLSSETLMGVLYPQRCAPLYAAHAGIAE